MCVGLNVCVYIYFFFQTCMVGYVIKHLCLPTSCWEQPPDHISEWGVCCCPGVGDRLWMQGESILKWNRIYYGTLEKERGAGWRTQNTLCPCACSRCLFDSCGWVCVSVEMWHVHVLCVRLPAGNVSPHCWLDPGMWNWAAVPLPGSHI